MQLVLIFNIRASVARRCLITTIWLLPWAGAPWAELPSVEAKDQNQENPLFLHQENGSSLDTWLPPFRATASPHLARTTLGVRPRMAGPVTYQYVPGRS